MGVGGRPTKYRPEYNEIVRNAVREFRATKAQLAELLGVTRETINDWEKKNPEFSDALKEAGNQLDQEVEQALAKRALGYTRTIERVSKEGTVQCEEEVPPDPVSCIFWLKNRQPGKWRDKQEHEVSGKDGGPIQAVINFGTRPKDK